MPTQSCGPVIHPEPHAPCRSTFNPDRGMANMLELTQRNHLADCGIIIVQRHLKEPCETCRSCFWERSSTTTTARGCWRATRMQSHKRVGSNNRFTRHLGNCWSSRTERIGWFRPRGTGDRTGHSLNNNVAGSGRNELITLPDDPSTQCGHDVWRGTQLLETS